MEIGKTLYVTNRKEWRAWLKKNHKKEKDIWLIYYNKKSGKLRIPYNDAVEEGLCFGWIDSIMKKINEEKFAQRFTPRRKNSQLSDMNKERIRRLIKQKKMTSTGLEAIKHTFNDSNKNGRLKIAPDILEALKKYKSIWKNFNVFPSSYKRIRIGWIEGARKRPDVFKQRLNYFLNMTAKNKRYGMVQ
jgi:uncharacterized protein YdeI (YjbR/CyaY-like superfamily)